MKSEHVWLVELLGDTPSYWGGEEEIDEDWIEDPYKAKRFKNKEEAERMIEEMGWTEARAVEHAFDSKDVPEKREEDDVS